MVCTGHRPLQLLTVGEPLIGDAGIDGREGVDLGHDVGCRFIVPPSVAGVSIRRCGAELQHPFRELDDDPRIGFGFSKRLDGFTHTLNAPFSIGKRALLFSKARSWEDHVSELPCLGEKEVLQYDKLGLLERVANVIQVRVTDHRVLTDDVKATHLPRFSRIKHLGDGQAYLVR